MSERAAPRLPLWLILAWIAAVAAYWWPGGLEFRSDDYLAVVYASDAANVWHDFVGPYQGAERLALFYRPLITLSVAIDTWLGGGGPFVPHLMNVAVHCVNSLLLLVLLRRFVGPWSALAAALYWSLHPGHTGAVSWMIGRVDTHATLFFLLALVLDRRPSRWPAFALFALGGMTKELCLTLPAAVFLLRLLHRQKPVAALRASVPYLWILCSLLALRWLFLGEVLGGYAAARLFPENALVFWKHLLPAAGVPLALGIAGAIAVLALGRKRLVAAPAVLALFAVTALPSAGAQGGAGVQTDRYLYLPAGALAGLAALGGPIAPLLLTAAQAPRALADRARVRALAARVRTIRDDVRVKLLRSRPEDDPLLVAAPAADGSDVIFHIGLDRLGVPPFGPGGRTVLPARPVFAGSADQQRPPPFGRNRTLYRGPSPLFADTLAAIGRGEERATLALEGITAERFSVLVATSLGWLWVRDLPARAGELHVADLLLARAGGSAHNLLQDLWPAIEVSLEPGPWIYLEARDGAGRVIGASRRPVQLPLDRGVGHGLQAKRPMLWLLGACLALTLLATWRSARREP